MCHCFPAFFPPKAHSHQINLLKAPLLTCYSHAQEATIVSCCLHRRAQYPLPDQQSSLSTCWPRSRQCANLEGFFLQRTLLSGHFPRLCLILLWTFSSFCDGLCVLPLPPFHFLKASMIPVRFFIKTTEFSIRLCNVLMFHSN